MLKIGEIVKKSLSVLIIFTLLVPSLPAMASNAESDIEVEEKADEIPEGIDEESTEDTVEEILVSTDEQASSAFYSEIIKEGYTFYVCAEQDVLSGDAEIVINKHENDEYHSLLIEDKINLLTEQGELVTGLDIFEFEILIDGQPLSEYGNVAVYVSLTGNSIINKNTSRKIKLIQILCPDGDFEIQEIEGDAPNSECTILKDKGIDMSNIDYSFLLTKDSEYALAYINYPNDEGFGLGYEPDEDSNEIESIYDYGTMITTFESAVLPSSFKTANMPKLRSQGQYGLCWAFSSTTLAEASMMTQSEGVVDYSELHTGYLTYDKHNADPLGGTEGDIVTRKYLEAGNYEQAAESLMQWRGAVDEEKVPYSSAEKVEQYGINSIYEYDDSAHMSAYYVVSMKDTEAVKRLVMDNGAVGISYAAYNSNSKAVADNVYSNANNAYYNPPTNTGSPAGFHAVAIVGWDDNFSKENFAVQPEGDGAWYVKNSWTNTDGDESLYGFFWMSYFEPSILNGAYSFVFEEEDKYDNNYQYDGGIYTNYISSYTSDLEEFKTVAANVFTAKGETGSEEIGAIAFETGNTNVQYTIRIYKNLENDLDPTSGQLCSTTTGSTTYQGYQRVELSDSVNVENGTKFAAVVELKKEGAQVSIGYENSWKSDSDNKVTAQSGQSFVLDNGSWTDFGTSRNANIRIKAYSKNCVSEIEQLTGIGFKDEIEDNGVEMKLGEIFKPSIVFTPSNAANRSLTWSSSNSEVASVEADGKVFAKKTGTTIVSAISSNNIKAQYEVRVVDGISALTIDNSENPILYYGEVGKFSVKYEPSDAILVGNVEWTSEDPSIVSINQNGEARGHEVGKTKIIASVDGKTAEIEVSVPPHQVCEVSYEVLDNQVVRFRWKKVPEATSYVLGLAYGSGIIYNFQIPDNYEGDYITFEDHSFEGDATITTRTRGIAACRNGELSSFVIPDIPYGTRYNISYITAPGTESSAMPDYYIGGHTKALKAAIPPTGYNFYSWYLEPEYTTRVTSISASYSGDLTLYAKYTPKTSYIYYDSNGGKGSVGVTTMKYDQDATVKTSTFTRTGYTFAGWNTRADGTGTEFEEGQIVRNLMASGTMYLYAQWNPLSSTITLEPQGGELEQTTKTVYYEQQYGTLPTPTIEGKYFLGWYTTISGGTQILPESKVSTTSNQTLYAKWAEEVVEVSFDTLGVGTVQPKYVEKGGLYGSLYSPERVGYIFDGWYLEKEYVTKIYNNTSVSSEENHTLYAKWTASDYYVYLYPNGGEGDTISLKLTYDEDVKLLSTYFTKSGYYIKNWNKQSNGSGDSFPADENVRNLSIDGKTSVYLYAQWFGMEFDVKFDPCDGTVEEAFKTVTFNGSYGTLPIPSREGFDFNGWYTAKEGGTRVTSTTKVQIYSNQTLYAHWGNKTVALNFESNGGSSADSKNVCYKGNYTNLPKPTRTGYKFVSWCLDKALTQTVDGETVVNTYDNHTLYAKWQPIKYYIKFSTSYGSLIDENTNTKVEIAYDEEYSLPDSMFNYPGHSFAGWNISENTYSKGTRVKNLSSMDGMTINAYAQWEACHYQIEFDANGGNCEQSKKEVIFGEKYGELPVPTRNGYTFKWWYISPNEYSSITSNTIVNITENTTLIARWLANPYTITLDANGGNVSQTSMSVRYGDKYDLPTPTYKGYTFLGWYTTDNQLVKNGDDVEILSNQTLTAKWTPTKYKVKLCANDGTSESKSYELTYNEGNLLLPENPYLRTGYTLKYWTTGADGYGYFYYDQGSVEGYFDFSSEELVLYARWNPIQYYISFDANGGIGSKTSISVIYDEQCYLSGSELTRSGYELAGWNTKADGSGTSYENESYVSNLTDEAEKTVCLYAVWTPAKVSVTFDSQGGSLVPSGEVTFGAKFGALPVSERANYTFLGWFTEADDGEEITSESEVNETAYTLYAHWTNQPVTIVFNSMGGSSIENKIGTVGDTYGELSEPERPGYDFVGWFSAIENGEQITSITAIPEGATVTLYAKWNPIQYYISFDANGGIGSKTSISVIYDEQCYLSGSELTRSGYELAGWNTKADGSGTSYENESYVSNLTDEAEKTVCLYAVWKPAKVSVTFDSQGGSLVPSGEVTFGAKFGALPVPTKTNDTFLGWFTEAADGEEITSESEVNETAYTLYAHWTNQPVTIVFNSMGGSSIENKTGAVGDTYGELSEPERPGYDFVGWFSAIENGEQITSTTAIPEGATVTLYARWIFEKEEQFWATGISDVTYTGQPITFNELKVYWGDELLVLGKDYSVAYKNNKNAGKATVTITGKGNFFGTYVDYFNITKAPIERALVETIYTNYNSKVQLMSPSIKYGSTTLKKNTDYTLIYPGTSKKADDYSAEAFKSVGTHYITVLGKGNYEGTTICTEIIKPEKTLINISKVKIVNYRASVGYTGESITQEQFSNDSAKPFSLKYAGETLVLADENNSGDYRVEYINNINIGTATVIFYGTGERFNGSIKKTFKITGIPLKNVIKGNFTAVPYTGNAYVLSDLSGVNVPFESCTVSYLKNTDVGTATVIFTGRGCYTGTVKKNFLIRKIDVSKFDSSFYSNSGVAIFSKAGARPEVNVRYNGMTLTEGKDYYLKLANNSAVYIKNKTPNVSIVGKGNYTGTLNIGTFSITVKDISNTTLTIADKVYSSKINGYKSSPILTDDGKALIAGKDYEKNVGYYYDCECLQPVGAKDIPNVGTTIWVKLLAKGDNYSGFIIGSYRILAPNMDISKAKIVIPKQIYSGKAVILDKNDIQISIGKTIIGQEDYSILGYTNNLNKGTATVTLAGNEERGYGGVKTVKFTIISRPVGYTIWFRGNGATSGSMNAQTLKNGKSAKLSKNTFVKKDSTFVGWKDSKGNFYTDKQMVEFEKDGTVLVLYAQWE